MPLNAFLDAASGRSRVDLQLLNAKLVNLYAGEIYPADVAVYGGKIVGFGRYAAAAVTDLQGAYLAPGLIDGHVHIESSLLTPSEFARAVVPRGTTTVIADPHEIVNVQGETGLEFMLAASQDLPLDIYLMLPSCVPASSLETNGAEFGREQLRTWIEHPRVLGIGEVMNYPGVVKADPDILAKVQLGQSKPVDGHAPLLSGADLSAYIVAGIDSEHECSQLEEAREKLRQGMYIMLREGSAARNLKALLPLVNEYNSRRIGFATDDRHPDMLMNNGHLDEMVLQALQAGIPLVRVLQLASLNNAAHYGLKDRGVLAVGSQADMISFHEPRAFKVDRVYKAGKLVARQGRLTRTPAVATVPADLKQTVNIRPVKPRDFKIPATGSQLHVIGLLPDQLITEKLTFTPRVEQGLAVSDVDRDLIKIAVIERHHGNGNIGLGFVKGMGLRQGALASTVAHDSHNLIVMGTNDRDMALAVECIQTLQGGMVIVDAGQIQARLPLPVAGLMSELSFREVNDQYQELIARAKRQGCRPADPFMILSFLALPVIPALKLTDQGLVDVTRMDFIALFTP